MTRRAAALSALATTALVLALAAPVVAKGGGEAALDVPIPRDAEPGSTVEVAWDAWAPGGEGRHPIVGSPLVLVVTGADGNVVEVMGAERPSGSGHYEASFVVPAGGIAEVMLGMRGTMCDPDGCVTSDLPLTFVEPPLVGPAWVVPAAVNPAEPVQPAAATTEAAAGVGRSDLPIPAVAAVLVAAVLAAIGAGLVGRRVRSASGAASRT